MTVVNTPSTFSKETLLKQGPILEVVIGYKIEQLDPSNSLYALMRTFLQYFKMEYDGMTGAVTLTKNPQHFS